MNSVGADSPKKGTRRTPMNNITYKPETSVMQSIEDPDVLYTQRVEVLN